MTNISFYWPTYPNLISLVDQESLSWSKTERLDPIKQTHIKITDRNQLQISLVNRTKQVTAQNKLRTLK